MSTKRQAWATSACNLRVCSVVDLTADRSYICAELAEAIPDRVEDRRRLLDVRQASGPLQAHTLAVNEVGLAFLNAARERGDEFSARSWRHEVAHPIGPAPGMRRGELLIADAAFTYLLVEPDALSFEYRLVELDRGTMPLDRLARKLSRYAWLCRFRPRALRGGKTPQAWRAHYRVFPVVLVCFADRPAPADRRRRRVVASLCRTDPELERTPGVRFSFCLLDELRERGPFAPIFGEPDRDEPVDWLGQGDGALKRGTTPPRRDSRWIGPPPLASPDRGADSAPGPAKGTECEW